MPKWKDEEASFTPFTFQIWSSHQEQTQEKQSKSPGQSASVERPAPLNSTQPNNGNASRLWGLTNRNSNHHPRHPRHPSQGAPHRWTAQVTDPGSSWCCLPIYHLGKSLHRWASKRGSKKWRRWSFHHAHWQQIHQEVFGNRAAVKNYRAEAYVLLIAAQTLKHEESLPTNKVFLTDCRSIL